MRLLKSGDFSLNCLIKAAMIEKEESLGEAFNLKDGLDAVLFYQKASDENKKAIDALFLYLGYRDFATLIDNHLENVRVHEEHCKKYSGLIALAHKTKAKD